MVSDIPRSEMIINKVRLYPSPLYTFQQEGDNANRLYIESTRAMYSVKLLLITWLQLNYLTTV